MTKLIAFDLDGTLAEIGKGIRLENLYRLNQLEAQGNRIAIVSGKPVDYLCGFLRQAGLRQPALVGENGAVIQLGVDLPPKVFHILPYSAEAKRSIGHMREQFHTLLPDMWYQPNQVCLTPFPKNEREFAAIARCLKANAAHLNDVHVYRHADSFDIIPCGVDKYHGMAYLGKLLQIPPEDTVAVGDGVNDYPMFDYAGFAIGVHVAEESRVDINFTDIGQALDYLLGE